ncbi:hypothetical protein B0H14DRAFT_2621058 [Mycena olivaceomarginata]|nr:hypothetical protein B0H14DRAFT_2621058 [Mycena olivaceomarginata]
MLEWTERSGKSTCNNARVKKVHESKLISTRVFGLSDINTSPPTPTGPASVAARFWRTSAGVPTRCMDGDRNVFLTNYDLDAPLSAQNDEEATLERHEQRTRGTGKGKRKRVDEEEDEGQGEAQDDAIKGRAKGKEKEKAVQERGMPHPTKKSKMAAAPEGGGQSVMPEQQPLQRKLHSAQLAKVSVTKGRRTAALKWGS